MSVEQVRLRTILSDRRILIIISINLLVMLGFGMILPILPLYARSFGVGLDAAGLLISSFAFARLAFDLVGGPLVDRYGERLIATVGLLIVGVSSLLAGLAPTFALVVVFRAVGGAGSSILFAALYSYMLKVVPKDRMARALSLFAASFNVGVVAGGPVGGAVAHALGLRAPLFFYAGVLGLAAVLFRAFVKDPPRARVDAPLTAEHALLERDAPFLRAASARVVERIRDRRLLTVMVTNLAFFWLVAGVYDTLVPLFGAEGLNMSEVAIGGVFAVALAAELMILYPAGRIADTVGRKPIMVLSFAGTALVTALLGFSSGPVVYGALLGLLGFGMGAASVLPAAMLSDVAPEEASGTAVGMFRFAGDLGFVLGPATAGLTARALGFEAAFAISAIAPLAALMVVLSTPETLRRPVDSSELTEGESR